MTKTEDTMILELRQLIGELRQKRLKRRNWLSKDQQHYPGILEKFDSYCADKWYVLGQCLEHPELELQSLLAKVDEAEQYQLLREMKLTF